MRYDLWRNWEEYYKNLGIPEGAISIDGIVSIEKFAKEFPRILFVFKDTNNFNYNRSIEERDLCKWIREEGPTYSMWFTVAKWAHGLLHGFQPFDSVPADKSELHEALLKIAVINLKKHTGSGTIDDNTVHLYAHQDKKLLRKQIEEIEPDIIVSGGVLTPLLWLLDLNLVSVSEEKVHSYSSSSAATWIFKNRIIPVYPMRHPTRADQRITYNHLRDMVNDYKKQTYENE